MKVSHYSVWRHNFRFIVNFVQTLLQMNPPVIFICHYPLSFITFLFKLLSDNLFVFCLFTSFLVFLTTI